MIQKILLLLLITTKIFAQTEKMFEPSKKWILVDNKIERKEIILQEYDSLLVDYNTLILKFLPNHTLEYDYESTAGACAGVDFLDIDTENTTWNYNPPTQIFTLTFKGGYATLDGFQFKREYKIETYGEKAMILVRTKEYYFTDLEKLASKAEKAQKKNTTSKTRKE